MQIVVKNCDTCPVVGANLTWGVGTTGIFAMSLVIIPWTFLFCMFSVRMTWNDSNTDIQRNIKSQVNSRKKIHLLGTSLWKPDSRIIFFITVKPLKQSFPSQLPPWDTLRNTRCHPKTVCLPPCLSPLHTPWLGPDQREIPGTSLARTVQYV